MAHSLMDDSPSCTSSVCHAFSVRCAATGQNADSNNSLRGESPTGENSSIALAVRPSPPWVGMNQPGLHFLYTNVGRGHPSYLDGIVGALRAGADPAPDIQVSDVFEESKGISLTSWRLARWLYRNGSSPGLAHQLYRFLRQNTDYNRPSIMLNIMGRSIRSRFLSDPRRLVVAHPTLVAMLRGRDNIIYQHGEVITPSEATVSGATTVLVPTPEAAEPFRNAGYKQHQMIITGMCIESALVDQAEECYDNRLRRIQGTAPLTGAFFSSGAEPRHHVEKLVTSAVSVSRSGSRVLIFAALHGTLQSQAMRAFGTSERGIVVCRPTDPKPDSENVLLVYESRAEEESITASWFSEFDYFVAPSHERTNWALGLGLPMFIVRPAIGPYAPLNDRRLTQSGVAVPLETRADTTGFAEALALLRSEGRIATMARAGWKPDDISGFRTAAAFLRV